MRYIAFAVGLAGWLWFCTVVITYFGKRGAKRAEENTAALKLTDALHRALAVNPALARQTTEAHEITDEVLNLLFEVKRRELKGTWDEMFSVRVSNLSGLDKAALAGERYDYRTGKTHQVRKNRALKVALSPEAKGLFEIHSRQFRGGAVLKGLSLSERGREVLVDILRAVQKKTEA